MLTEAVTSYPIFFPLFVGLSIVFILVSMILITDILPEVLSNLTAIFVCLLMTWILGHTGILILESLSRLYSFYFSS